MKLLFAGVAALSLLLAGAAVAGSCIEYCGTFARRLAPLLAAAGSRDPNSLTILPRPPPFPMAYQASGAIRNGDRPVSATLILSCGRRLLIGER